MQIEDVQVLADGTKRFSVRCEGILVRGWRQTKDGNIYAPGTKTRSGWYNIVDLANTPEHASNSLKQTIASHPELGSTSSVTSHAKCFACANPGCDGLRHSADCQAQTSEN